MRFIFMAALITTSCSWMMSHPKQDIEVVQDVVKDVAEIEQVVEKG